MTQDYRHAHTSVTLINYHFVWIVRRRKAVLVGAIASRLEELLKEKVAQMDCKILALEIMPDHIHLFLNCPPVLAPSIVMHHLKGATAYILRKEFPQLKKLPSMWTRSFFCSTAGNVSSETIRKYIENHHTR